MQFDVTIEIPKGQRNKYEVDHKTGRLRLDLAQFRELEAFSAFGSDLDAASKAQLARGSRLVELLKQPQYQPQAMEREVVSVWSGTTGQLDDVPVEDIRRFDAEFLDYLAFAEDLFGVWLALGSGLANLGSQLYLLVRLRDFGHATNLATCHFHSR